MINRLLNFFSSLHTDTIRSYQFYQGSRMLAVILSSILLVKLGAGTEDMSNFEWIFFGFSILSFFWAEGLMQGILNYYPSLKEGNNSTFLKSLAILFLATSAFVAFVAYGADSVNLYSLGEYKLELCLYFFFAVNSSLIVLIFLLKKDARAIYRFTMLSYVSMPIAIVVGYLLFGFGGAVRALVLWELARFLYFIMLSLGIEGGAKSSAVYPFLLFSLPLLVQGIIVKGMSLVDGFLVVNYFDDEFFALYRYGARELPINTVLITGLVSATIPAAVTDLKGTLKNLRIRVSKLMYWLFPLSIILIFISDWGFQLAYSADYHVSSEVFKVFLLVLSVRILLPQVCLYALKKNTLIMSISFIEILSNLILSLLLIPYFGLMGIAYATLLGAIIQNVLMLLFVKFRYSIPLSLYINIPLYLFFTSLLFIAFLVEQFFIS